MRFVLFCACSTLCLTPAQVLRQITDSKVDVISSYAIDDDGSTVVAVSSADGFGGNAAHAFQIMKWTFPGGAGSQLTDLSRGVTGPVSVADDGLTVAFISSSDPLGLNHNASSELFLISSDGMTISQLTNDPSLPAGAVEDAVISGSGNRVIFVANADPLTTNPNRYDQLFAIDVDGSNLIQLTFATAFTRFSGLSISDDGQRIAFAASGLAVPPDNQTDLFIVEADGSNFSELASDIGGSPQISGNGNWIVYIGGFREVTAISWTGAGPTVIATGQSPVIATTALWVYFYDDVDGNDEIYRVRINGSALTQLTSTSLPLENRSPVLSGDDSKLIFGASGGAHSGGSNPDGGSELMLMDAIGANVQQLTLNGPSHYFDHEPDITPDGSVVVFRGSGPLGDDGLFRMLADGSQLTAVISGASPWHPTVSADGNTIAFGSWEDLTGQAPCGNGSSQIFIIQADGTGLTQLTPTSCANNRGPEISGDGSMVVFYSNGDIVGLSQGVDLFAVSLPGGTFTRITDGQDFTNRHPRLSNDGLWVVYQTHSNVDGVNADGGYEVFRARTDGSLVERITADPNYWSEYPDISADGNLIVYESGADPLGTNADNNSEIFLYDATFAATQQLTISTDGGSVGPIISGDGTFVYFASNAPFFGANPAAVNEVYRVTVATGLIERASGLRGSSGGFGFGRASGDRSRIVVDAVGRAVFVSTGDGAGGTNLDHNVQLWWVDFSATGRLEPSSAAPTVVSWEPEPGPIRYDVIRGDVANLAAGSPDGVDLGAVVCLEDDSPDNTTVGFEDLDQPSAGQVFFFVHRGSQGLLDGPGSYDHGRVPAAGDCPE